MDSLPEFLSRMRALLGEQYEAYLEASARPPVSGLRVNTLKIQVPEFMALSPFPLAPVPWSPAGFTIQTEIMREPTNPTGGNNAQAASATPGKHPYHAAGLYYLQEPAAMLAGELLAPRPGERVLDMAAAPGGKATHLAAFMQNAGLLVANEIHPRRVWDLAENLERCGVRNAAITNASPEQLVEHFGAYFDRVLLDAPCSGEGMFRKSSTARADWSPALVQGCSARQTTLLAAAARLVRPGGRLVYSTCTFAPEENENVIARFLATQAEFELIAIDRRPEFAPGLTQWSGQAYPLKLERTVRLWPHRAACEGHFLAVLVRAGPPAPSAHPARLPSRIPGPLLRAFHAFEESALSGFQTQPDLALVGSYLYQIPSELPNHSGLRVIHPGWWLGTFKSGAKQSKPRFEPSHAFALGLSVSQARQVLPLATGLDDQRIIKYLHGECLPDAGPDGWVLVAVDGYSLGWGKRSQGILKNEYPKGLRW